MKKDGTRWKTYDRHIYAAYRGDEWLMDGTLDEIAARTGRKRKSLQLLLTPSFRRREAEIAKRGTMRNRLSLVRVE